MAKPVQAVPSRFMPEHCAGKFLGTALHERAERTNVLIDCQIEPLTGILLCRPSAELGKLSGSDGQEASEVFEPDDPIETEAAFTSESAGHGRIITLPNDIGCSLCNKFTHKGSSRHF